MTLLDLHCHGALGAEFGVQRHRFSAGDRREATQPQALQEQRRGERRAHALPGPQAQRQQRLESEFAKDEFVGHLMVFRTFDKVSYALVMSGVRPIHAGDTLKHPDATQ